MYSKAEQIVVDHLVKGLSNKDIAERVFVSEKTVKFHLGNIYKKAFVSTRSEFIAKFNGNVGTQVELEPEITHQQHIQGEIILESGAKPIVPAGERKTENVKSVTVVKSQEDKIMFIDDKFKVGETITQLHSMMKEVTAKELTPSTVNAACNCVARLNETINTAITAARFLNER